MYLAISYNVNGVLLYGYRYARLNELSNLRAQKLEDSKKLQQFLRNAEEVKLLHNSITQDTVVNYCT